LLNVCVERKVLINSQGRPAVAPWPTYKALVTGKTNAAKEENRAGLLLSNLKALATWPQSQPPS
jgi:hypothetical protein